MTTDELDRLLPTSTLRREALDEAQTMYEMELALTASGSEWLETRGISAETASGFRLGIVSDEPPVPEHRFRNGWLAIPYLGHDGAILTVRFRCLAPGCQHERHGKYMSMQGDPSRTFNVGAIHRAAAGVGGDRAVHITEGELDAVVLTQVGFHAIAIPGAKGWQPRHRVMLDGIPEVWVWGDPDKAGIEFSQKVQRSIRRARIVPLDGGDVGEVHLAKGADYLRNLVA